MLRQAACMHHDPPPYAGSNSIAGAIMVMGRVPTVNAAVCVRLCVLLLQHSSLQACRHVDLSVLLWCERGGTRSSALFLTAAGVEMFISSTRRGRFVMKRLSEGARTTWLAS